jgi:prepilin-type N-terminal cleavage/methylation domain-containing protein
MTYPTRRQWGFTLIELMVALAVLVTFALLAVPSFQSLRQRSALRGAGEHMLSFWSQARFEAAKRNSNIKVAVESSTSSGAFCLGAATTASTSAASGCDCFTSNACDVAQFPADNTDWDNVTLSGVTLGSSNWPSVATIKPVIIEPKTTSLTDSATAGTVTVNAPALGNRQYQLRLSIDQFGRGVLCEPSGAVDKLSDYHLRRC